MRIPSTPARTLSGLNVRVPDDFTGARNGVLFVFDRSHLVAVPAWQAVLRDALAGSDGCFYVLILADPVPAWRRYLTEMALRLETPEPALIEDTALIWMDRQRWLERSGAPGDNEPLLGIASPDGTIHALAPGMPKPGITARLSDALRSA